MTFESLKMGSYGAYVWSCYGLTLVCLLAVAWSARSAWQTQLTLARRRLQMTASNDAAGDSVIQERAP